MTWRVIHADVLKGLAAIEPESAQTVVTSPPYWGLRDYGVDGRLGLEPTPDLYVERMVETFRAVRRVLRRDGTVWLNLGDCYAASRSGDIGENSGLSGSRRVMHESRRAQESAGRQNRRWTFEPWGLKPKDLVGIPWRVALALQAEGWWLRSDIVWAKPNAMPESVTDRPTRAHEYLFLLARSERYYYDAAAVREPFTSSESDLRKMIEQRDRIGGHAPEDPRARANGQTRLGRKRSVGEPEAAAAEIRRRRSGNKERRLGVPTGTNTTRGTSIPWEDDGGGRNMRSVWNVATEPYPGAHFATFPKALVVPCVKAGSRPGDTVLDPFCGSGTTGLVSLRLGRSFVGIELSAGYAEMARNRIRDDGPLFNTEAEVPT
ncbi:MAG: DNA-methyltransferase [Actinomycetota bacterium]